jgi:hypothetical protein
MMVPRLAAKRSSRSSAQTRSPRVASMGKRSAGSARRKACSSPRVAVSRTRCFEDGLLTIQGERYRGSAADGQKVHRGERRYGPYRRSFTLPAHVDAEKIEASAQDGVLQVRIPKAKDMRPKRIEVRAASDHGAPSGGTAAHNGS